jgi:Pathogenicity locus
MSQSDLQALPNVGPAVARMLVDAGIERPDDLRGQTADQLYHRLCQSAGHRLDPCLLDTLVAVFDHANGAPPQPWWYYSRLRGDVRSASRYEALAHARLPLDA